MTVVQKIATEVRPGDVVRIGSEGRAVLEVRPSYRKIYLRLVLEGIGSWDVARDQEIALVV